MEDCKGGLCSNGSGGGVQQRDLMQWGEGSSQTADSIKLGRACKTTMRDVMRSPRAALD